MISLSYTSPEGERPPAPLFHDLIEALRELPEQYWNSTVDTGFATLESIVDGKGVSTIVFTKKNGYGVHVTYRDRHIRLVADGSFYLRGSDDWNDVTSLNLSGELIYIPRALFVSVDEAANVFKEFYADGEIKNLSNWISVRNLRWNVETGKCI